MFFLFFVVAFVKDFSMYKNLLDIVPWRQCLSDDI